ncbi:MAG: hypothetical protein J3R72DRAFT_416215 [Linnemannia gamsii]|nr:MAG: hypothetical protein J3R72DRAFT_416215 [Linnemannia gamsii]
MTWVEGAVVAKTGERKVKGIWGWKKRQSQVGLIVCSSWSGSGLENLLVASPYASTLLIRSFVELDSPLCELLNEYWRLQPQLQYACAQALAGSIFLNTTNSQDVIINTVEAYGRKKNSGCAPRAVQYKKVISHQDILASTHKGTLH